MNIILAEERPRGVQLQEQSFSQGVILVGRDAFECDIAFDNSQFPMVSRKHAELQWHDGKWIVVDLNSSYGVFVNGQIFRIQYRTWPLSPSLMEKESL